MANDSPEMWTITQAAEYLGVKPSSARGQLSRWKIPRTYAVGDTGRPEARYDADAIRTAHTARPGRGSRTDLPS